MANISVTAVCNRDCGYCFARAALGGGAAYRHMPRERFREALDFLERSLIDQARLLGGEPTLHPEFARLVDLVVERGLRLLVFSNGMMPEAALRRLEEAPAERVSVLVHVSAAQGRQRQAQTLARLGQRATLSFNIDSPAFQPGFLLELIRAHGLGKSVRFGLAHPCVGAENRFLHPRYYRAAGQRLVDFAQQAAAEGVETGLDCGFVPCMFPPGGLELLGKEGAEAGLRCGPIPDVLPDGQVVACYPLAALHREPLPAREDAAWLRRRFDRRQAPYRAVGVFRECAECPTRAAERCTGGCLSVGMLRLRGETETRRQEAKGKRQKSMCPDTEARMPVARWVVPYVDQPLAFWERLEADYGGHIREVYFPLPGGIVGSGRPPQPAEHLEEFLRGSSLPRGVLVNPITLPAAVDEIAPRVIEALRRLMGDHGIRGATVSNLLLAARIREKLPELPLAASVLMDVARPNQALMLEGICETLVPASRVVRDLAALQALRDAFAGRIRLIVNEACLPGCPYRVEHFHEMGSGVGYPESLCRELLEREPWMRLTGAWVLPQHLHLYDGLHDELKLAGRVTLRGEAAYRRVLGAYVARSPLPPHEIGGGPASVLEPIQISEEFFAKTLACGQACHACHLCREYWEAQRRPISAPRA